MRSTGSTRSRSRFDVARLPFSLKMLLENLLRNEDGVSVRKEDIEALASWDPNAEPSKEIAFTPARVVMQDFTGVPGGRRPRRDARRDGRPRRRPVEDQPARARPSWSSTTRVQVDVFGTRDAFRINAEREFERNEERYAFLRWGQSAFEGFVVVPPDTGIVHQVNLEYLARVVFENDGVLYPDTLVGTDSHTTMINGLGVLGWGVGGIEAEAAMLGQPMSMLIPHVVGFKLAGELPEGATATDLVLTVTQMLREHGVVGKFVEFYGPGIPNLPLADRATIGNMSPEFGSTCAIFPIDAETLRYLRVLRPPEGADRARRGVRARAGPVARRRAPRSRRTRETLELDLGDGRPVAGRPEAPAGPRLADRVQGGVPARAGGPAARRRPQYQRASTRRATESFPASDPPATTAATAHDGSDPSEPRHRRPAGRRARASTHVPVTLADGTETELDHGHVVIAAITSCTNTSNPSVMLAAGLLAKNAVEKGLESKPWVKTSLAPGSKVVTEYYDARGLVDDLEDARLPPRRLRLHDLHRQLRPAAGGDLRASSTPRTSRSCRVLSRQPQLRGPHQPRREDELPGVAAAGGRLRARGDDGHRPARRAARPGRATATTST